MNLKRILATATSCIAISVFAMLQTLLVLSSFQIAASFGYGPGWSCLLFAAFAAPYIFISPATGKVFAAAGHHLSVTLSLSLCAVSTIFLSCADHILLVFPGLILLGIAAVFVLLASADAIAALTSRPCADCIPLCALFFAIGAAIGCTAAGILSSFGHDWRSILFIFGTITAAAALLHAIVPFPRLPHLRASRWLSEFSSAMRMQRMYPFFFAILLYAGIEILATVGMALYMIQSLGYTALIASLAVSLIWLCTAIGRFFCSRLTAYCSPSMLSAILCAILALTLILCAAIPDGTIFWFAICFIGVGLSGLWQLLFSSSLKVNQGSAATLSSLLFWSCIGECLLLTAATALSSVLGMRAVIFFTVFLLFIDAFLLSGLLPHTTSVHARPDWSAPDAEDDPELEFEELNKLYAQDEFSDLPPYDEEDAFSNLDLYEDDGLAFLNRSESDFFGLADDGETDFAPTFGTAKPDPYATASIPLYDDISGLHADEPSVNDAAFDSDPAMAELSVPDKLPPLDTEPPEAPQAADVPLPSAFDGPRPSPSDSRTISDPMFGTASLINELTHADESVTDQLTPGSMDTPPEEPSAHRTGGDTL